MFWPILYEVKSYFQIFGRIWWFKEFLKCLFFEKFTSVLTHFVWRKILVLRFLNFWAKLTILSIFRNFQFLKNLQVFWPILYEVKSYFQIFGRIWWFKEFLKCLFFEKFTSVLTHFVWRKILVLRFLNFWAKLMILSIFRNFQFLKHLQVFWPILYEEKFWF